MIDFLFPGFSFLLLKIIAVLVLILYVIMLVWVYRDAARRGRPPGFVVLFVALTGPMGALAWLISRPK